MLNVNVNSLVKAGKEEHENVLMDINVQTAVDQFWKWGEKSLLYLCVCVCLIQYSRQVLFLCFSTSDIALNYYSYLFKH